MSRHSVLASLMLVACAPRPTPAGEGTTPTSMSTAALMRALDETAPASRVYLPQEVASPAVTVEESDRPLAVLPTSVEPTVRIAAVRGIVDTRGVTERATLTVLPGSDPREASILQQRVLRTRWRPARLANGQAVRQLFEWRFCVTGGTTCAYVPPEPLERGIPRVFAH